jgi:hypothetical protein
MVYRKRGNSQWTDIPLPEHTSQRRNEIPIGPSNYGPVLFFYCFTAAAAKKRTYQKVSDRLRSDTNAKRWLAS